MKNVILGCLAATPLSASPSGLASADGPESSLDAVAKRFFRGVYGCDADVVDELASPESVISYPSSRACSANRSFEAGPTGRLEGVHAEDGLR